MVHDLVPRVADPNGLLGAEDEGRMATFLSMPLRGRRPRRRRASRCPARSRTRSARRRSTPCAWSSSRPPSSSATPACASAHGRRDRLTRPARHEPTATLRDDPGSGAAEVTEGRAGEVRVPGYCPSDVRPRRLVADPPGCLPPVDPDAFRRAVGHFATGVTVVTTRVDGSTTR